MLANEIDDVATAREQEVHSAVGRREIASRSYCIMKYLLFIIHLKVG